MSVRYVEITSSPTSVVECFEGDTFDLSDFVVTATMTDGTTVDVTDEVTVTPNPLTDDISAVVFHYIDEDDEEHTISYSNIKVYTLTRWKYLDGKGLEYFYLKLLQTFLPRSSSDDYTSEDHYNKVIVYNNAGKISYSPTSTNDLSLIQDISTIVSNTPTTKAQDFINLINKINTDKGYVNTTDVMTDAEINAILNS